MADRAGAKSKAKSRVNEAGNYTKPGLGSTTELKQVAKPGLQKSADDG